jgi:hypothetical protein
MTRYGVLYERLSGLFLQIGSDDCRVEKFRSWIRAGFRPRVRVHIFVPVQNLISLDESVVTSYRDIK